MPLNGDYDGSIVAVLEQLRLTADLEGLAVLDLSQDAADAPAAYLLGVAGRGTAGLGQALLSRNPVQASHTIGTDKRPDSGLSVGAAANPSGRAAAVASAARTRLDRGRP